MTIRFIKAQSGTQSTKDRWSKDWPNWTGVVPQVGDTVLLHFGDYNEEVLKLFELLWEWTPTPRYMLPSKHVIENLVGLMRGCQTHDYCYISRGDVARIIRKESKNRDTGRTLSVHLCKDADQMTDNEFYDNGKWNYKPTALVDLLWNMNCNPQFIRE